MDQLPSKLYGRVKRSAAQKYRIMAAQKLKGKTIARNERDGVQKDFSLTTQETNIQDLKQRYPEAFMFRKIQVYNTKRRAQDEALIEKRQLQKQRLAAYGIAQVKIIMQDYPDMMRQSIEYLTSLSDQAQLSVLVKNAINKSSIELYYSRLFTKGATWAFYKHSTALLNQRILDIIQEFHKPQQKYPPQMNIQIQILAHFFKNVLQFQSYLPSQILTHTLHLNLTVVTQILKLTTEQISQLRRIYIQNSPKITYLEGFNLRPLANAYYFIMLKQKALIVKYSAQLDNEINKVIGQLKIQRAQAMEKEKSKQIKGEEVQSLYSLSELYARRQITKKGKAPSTEELLQKISTYERLIELQSLKNYIGPEEIKKMTQWEEVDYDYFKKYQRRKRKLLEKCGNKLSELKDNLIKKQLIQNPYHSYEQVFSNIYHRTALYVERSYFEGNVHRLLEKETHNQQLRYLEKVFKAAFECKGKTNVFFIDRCSLIEGRESAIVTVSLAGDLHCKKSPDSLQFLKEVEKLLLKIQQFSVVLLFDDKFPFSERLEKSEELFLISKIHSLCFLPRASLVPNPCQEIANSLKQMFTEQCSLEEAIQNALEEFDRRRVMQVALKEFEKAQRLAYPDSPQCNQQSEANKDERADSNIEEGSDLQDNQDEDVKFFFPQQSKEGFSPSTPQPLIMENLLERSASDLQLALARYLQLNKSKSILRNP